MVEEALAEGKWGDGDRKRRATAGCGFECASAVGFLSVGNVLFFFFLLFCASLPLFVLRRAVHLPCKMSGRLSECLDEWLVGTLVSSFNGPQEMKLKLCLRLGEQSKHLQAVRQINYI